MIPVVNYHDFGKLLERHETRPRHQGLVGFLCLTLEMTHRVSDRNDQKCIVWYNLPHDCDMTSEMLEMLGKVLRKVRKHWKNCYSTHSTKVAGSQRHRPRPASSFEHFPLDSWIFSRRVPWWLQPLASTPCAAWLKRYVHAMIEMEPGLNRLLYLASLSQLPSGQSQRKRSKTRVLSGCFRRFSGFGFGFLKIWTP